MFSSGNKMAHSLFTHSILRRNYNPWEKWLLVITSSAVPLFHPTVSLIFGSWKIMMVKSGEEILKLLHFCTKRTRCFVCLCWCKIFYKMWVDIFCNRYKFLIFFFLSLNATWIESESESTKIAFFENCKRTGQTDMTASIKLVIRVAR